MRNRRTLAVLTGAITITLLGVSIASAHVEFDPDSVSANKRQMLALSIPHDCSASSKTTEIKLQLPSNFDVKSFSSVGVFQHGKILKSWKEVIITSGGKSYLDIKGAAIKAGPDMGANALTLKFSVTTPAAKGSQLKFPAVQYCTGGLKVNWIQPRPADGSDPAESATPVPVLNLK